MTEGANRADNETRNRHPLRENVIEINEENPENLAQIKSSRHKQTIACRAVSIREAKAEMRRELTSASPG